MDSRAARIGLGVAGAVLWVGGVATFAVHGWDAVALALAAGWAGGRAMVVAALGR